MSHPTDLPSAPEIAHEILEYFRRRLDVPDLCYLSPPQVVPNGWVTYLFRLQLGRQGRMPEGFQAPVALRLYAGTPGLPRLRREYDVVRRLARGGYPVARPLLVEENAAALGGPFLVMEWVPGETQLELLERHPFLMWWVAHRMGETHARLHQVPVEEGAGAGRSFLRRSLDEMEGILADYGLRGLRPGLEWLRAHRPAETQAPALLHLDFHADNLIFQAARPRAVLDWAETDVGDRHADVADALLLFDWGPVQMSDLAAWERFALPLGRCLARRWYFEGYRRLLPLDARRLHYYGAWAVLRRLTMYGYWLHAGPWAIGAKPELLGHLQPGPLAALARRFFQQTGVPVRLDWPAPAGEGPSLTLPARKETALTPGGK